MSDIISTFTTSRGPIRVRFVVDAVRQGDVIEPLAVEGDADTLLAAQANRVAEWNSVLGRRLGRTAPPSLCSRPVQQIVCLGPAALAEERAPHTPHFRTCGWSSALYPVSTVLPFRCAAIPAACPAAAMNAGVVQPRRTGLCDPDRPECGKRPSCMHPAISAAALR